MEQNKNAKCPFCGAELYVGYTKGTGLCTACKKQFDVAKAVKLMQTVSEEVKEEPMVATGEAYLEVDRILTRAEFYLERGEFENARRELEDALKITNVDYRVYFGLVRVETQNLTDYKNQSHKPFLEKALSCADLDEKATIKRLYKDFYQLSKCSDEEVLIFQGEKNVAVKNSLEKKLKELIPTYIKMEGGLKLKLILFICFAVLGVSGLVLGFVFTIDLVVLLGAACAMLAYIFARGHFANKRTVKLFNALLDFYDVMDNYEFSVDQKKKVLDSMKLCSKAFSEKHNERSIETELYRLTQTVCESGVVKAAEFFKNHAVLCEFYNYFLSENE